MTEVTEPTHIIGYMLQLIRQLTCIHEADYAQETVRCPKCGLVFGGNRRKKERRA